MEMNDSYASGGTGSQSNVGQRGMKPRRTDKLDWVKPKDLLLMPHSCAKALRDDGWWLRSTIVWEKPSALPESVKDRPTVSHSYVFMFAKSMKYLYNADAIRETSVMHKQTRNTLRVEHPKGDNGRGMHRRPEGGTSYVTRNARTVWKINTEPSHYPHMAMMPQALARKCILAGSNTGDTVLDPFVGSGTTLLVAKKLGRGGIGIDLNIDYIEICKQRLNNVALELAI